MVFNRILSTVILSIHPYKFFWVFFFFLFCHIWANPYNFSSSSQSIILIIKNSGPSVDVREMLFGFTIVQN